MSHRFLASLGAILVVSAAVWCATMPIAAQSPATTRDVQAIKEAERKLIKEVADGLKKRDAALFPQADGPEELEAGTDRRGAIRI